MKLSLPIPRIRPEAILGFLLKHVEKFVVAVFAILGLWLTWGGVAATTNESVRAGLNVDDVEKLAVEAERHITAQRDAPTEWLAPPAAMAVAIDRWRHARPANPGPLSPLDRPLTGELAARTKPEVFPVEDLRAVACLAVLKPKPQEQPASTPAPQPPVPNPNQPAAAPGASAAPGAAPGRRRKPATPEPASQEPSAPVQPAAPREAVIRPFVVVTGLIPVQKQHDEYRLRYSQVRLRDPRRDAPWWCDYDIERLTVAPDKPEEWKPIDLGAARKLQEEWFATPDPVRREWKLSPLDDGRNPKNDPETSPSLPLPLCGPLPPLKETEEPWGRDAVHPWFLERLRSATPTSPAPAPPAAAANGPLEPSASEPVAQGGGAPVPAAFAQFRFVDANVEPGRSYRYRVRLRLWNPNNGLPRQEVVDPALSGPAKIVSPESVATAAVSVPNPLSLLVEPPSKDDRRIRPGMVEMLVLAPSDRTGGFALRGVVTEPGGAVRVGDVRPADPKRPEDPRYRGEPINSERMVVDIRPRSEVAGQGKPPAVSEPLDVLLLRVDGGLEIVSAADSQAQIDRHRGTLPAPADPKAKPADEPPATPSANPFAVPPEAKK